MLRRNFLASMLVAGLALAVSPIASASSGHSHLDCYKGRQPEKIVYFIEDKSAELWYPTGAKAPNGEQWYTVEPLKMNHKFDINQDIQRVHHSDTGETQFYCSGVVVTIDDLEFRPKACWMLQSSEQLKGNENILKYNDDAHFCHDRLIITLPDEFVK